MTINIKHKNIKIIFKNIGIINISSESEKMQNIEKKDKKESIIYGGLAGIIMSIAL
jgi:hypothetical protein